MKVTSVHITQRAFRLWFTRSGRSVLVSARILRRRTHISLMLTISDSYDSISFGLCVFSRGLSCPLHGFGISFYTLALCHSRKNQSIIPPSSSPPLPKQIKLWHSSVSHHSAFSLWQYCSSVKMFYRIKASQTSSERRLRASCRSGTLKRIPSRIHNRRSLARFGIEARVESVIV